MRITQVENLFQLSFMPRLFPVNCYLVEEEHDLTLIDAALPYSINGILHAAGQIGKPLGRIVLTHVHDDHVGALDALKEKYPGIPVYISARDERLLKGDISLDEDEPQTEIRGGVPKKIRTRADVHVKEGEAIGSLMPIFTPGHTPGSMSFVDIRSRAVIVGDAFQVRGGLAISGRMRPLFPFPAWATWNKERALASARKLIDLNPTLLAAGHGRMIKDPVQQMYAAVMDAENVLTMGSHRRREK